MSYTFEEEYWIANYSSPETMDCIGNAKEHVRYMRALFSLEFIDISSIIDCGFGLGVLFQKVLKEFLPYKACGLEPSNYAFERVARKKMSPVESTKLTLLNESLEEWCARKDSSRLRFDLGLCTSIFQYLSEENLQKIIPVLARRVKYLYLTVPTDIELKHQIEDLNFNDKYAIARSREFYMKLMREHFTLISSKVWESKHYFSEQNTHFSDLLYRV